MLLYGSVVKNQCLLAGTLYHNTLIGQELKIYFGQYFNQKLDIYEQRQIQR